MNKRRSHFDLMHAANYLRLAYQSMSRDQDEAAVEVKQIREMAGDDRISLLVWMADLCAGRARKVANEDEEEKR